MLAHGGRAGILPEREASTVCAAGDRASPHLSPRVAPPHYPTASHHRLWMRDEPAETREPCDHAVDAKRRQPPTSFEIAHQKAHAQISGNRGQHAAKYRIAKLLRRMKELRPFDQARGKNNRRADQKREFGSLLRREPCRVARDHREAAARETGDQRADLCKTDKKRLPERELFRRTMRARALQTVAQPQQDAVHDQRDRHDTQVVKYAL